MTYNFQINDYIGRWGVSKQWVQNQLSPLKGKDVSVYISSFGGELDHGLNIRQLFVDHGGVNAYLYGYVASAATVLACGCKKVSMSKYGFYLIHQVSNWVDAWGSMNATQIQEAIDRLTQNKEENQKMDLVLAQMYADRCKKPVAELVDILKKGTWLTAQEALDYGFIDEIIEEGEKLNFDDATSTKFNYLGLPDLPKPGKEAESKEPTIFTSILNGINELKDKFLSKGEKEPEQPEITITMNKTFVKVNELLAIEGVQVNDGKITLTEEQLKTLNEKLDSATKESDDKQTKIDSLEQQVENLKASAGDETGKELDDTTDDASNPYKNAQEMFDRV